MATVIGSYKHPDLYHSAAVGEDGALFVWGSGECGQLGTGYTASRLAPTRVAGLPAPVRQVAAGRSGGRRALDLGRRRRGRSDDADAGGAGAL